MKIKRRKSNKFLHTNLLHLHFQLKLRMAVLLMIRV